LRVKCKERGRFLISQMIEHILSPNEEHCGAIVSPGTFISFAQKDSYTPQGGFQNSHIGSVELVELKVETKLEWDAKNSQSSLISSLNKAIEYITPPLQDLKVQGVNLQANFGDFAQDFSLLGKLQQSSAVLNHFRWDDEGLGVNAGQFGVDMLSKALLENENIETAVFVLESISSVVVWFEQFQKRPKIIVTAIQVSLNYKTYDTTMSGEDRLTNYCDKTTYLQWEHDKCLTYCIHAIHKSNDMYAGLTIKRFYDPPKKFALGSLLELGWELYGGQWKDAFELTQKIGNMVSSVFSRDATSENCANPPCETTEYKDICENRWADYKFYDIDEI
jgi:hypothetical protein